MMLSFLAMMFVRVERHHTSLQTSKYAFLDIEDLLHLYLVIILFKLIDCLRKRLVI